MCPLKKNAASRSYARARSRAPRFSLSCVQCLHDRPRWMAIADPSTDPSAAIAVHRVPARARSRPPRRGAPRERRPSRPATPPGFAATRASTRGAPFFITSFPHPRGQSDGSPPPLARAATDAREPVRVCVYGRRRRRATLVVSRALEKCRRAERLSRVSDVACAARLRFQIPPRAPPSSSGDALPSLTL